MPCSTPCGLLDAAARMPERMALIWALETVWVAGAWVWMVEFLVAMMHTSLCLWLALVVRSQRTSGALLFKGFDALALP